jgi:polysaccharide export outer membrane protein
MFLERVSPIFDGGFAISEDHGVHMKRLAYAAFAVAAILAFVLQQRPATAQTRGGATELNNISNLPVAQIGIDDLIGVTVYDSPELTRTVRVSPAGDISLPMVKRPIHAAGSYPGDLENAITAALIRDHVLVDPVVTVSIVEYQSRSITVVGAVKSPLTFQATGNVTLLDAISKAQGLTDNAGSEILVSDQAPGEDGKPNTLLQRVQVQGLINGTNPSLNLSLRGGEVIRVPEAGRVFVLGDVKKPGAFYITDGAESSVLKALALSGGLDAHSRNTAYIYRTEGGTQGRNEIPVELKKIMDRKTPDVALLPNDILYVPDATGRRASQKVLESTVGVASILGAALLYTH